MFNSSFYLYRYILIHINVFNCFDIFRFAEYMEGNSHLEDDEILAYESKSRTPPILLTDDSDSEEN